MILTVIAGPNGSGKSTLTSSLSPEERHNLVDPDAIARDLNPVDPGTKAMQAGREAVRRWEHFLSRGESFLIETTLAGSAVISLMREAKAAGYQIRLTYVALRNAELHIERVRLRVTQGGHNIPDEDVRRRYLRSLAQAPNAIRVADESMIFDNSDLNPRQIFLFHAGRLVWQDRDLPDWCADLLNLLGADPADC